jgi:hypothetical protein
MRVQRVFIAQIIVADLGSTRWKAVGAAPFQCETAASPPSGDSCIGYTQKPASMARQLLPRTRRSLTPPGPEAIRLLQAAGFSNEVGTRFRSATSIPAGVSSVLLGAEAVS